MMLKPPVWGPSSNAVPQRTAGYTPAQQGAAVPPAQRSQSQSEATNRNTAQLQNSQQNSQASRPNASSSGYQNQGQANTEPSKRSGFHVVPKPVQRSQDNPRETQGQVDPALVHRKIWTIGGRKKFIDFVDKLSLAKVEDFANIHGIGGKDHARNSVIGVTICDYSNGTGGSSLTLNGCIDVEDVDQLYEAAKLARLGKLRPDSRLEIQWMNAVQRQVMDFQRFTQNPDGSRSIPAAALNALIGTISNARKALEPIIGAPFYTYATEKNNPYAVKNGLAPCYKLLITYSPFQKDGSPSGYPWYIRIETFDAPLSVQKNGTSSHDSKKATNRRSVFINLTCDDFWRAMVAINRYVRVWENHRTQSLFEQAEQRLTAQREKWASENQYQGYR